MYRISAVLIAVLMGAMTVRADPSGTSAYRVSEVRFRNDGLELAGSLLLPPGSDLPGAMMIHGSGASDRGNRWAFSIADALARCGVAVLIPDKRGSGQSQGDWTSADFGDLAGDARAGWELLRAEPAIGKARVGYLGLSQGGHVAPLAAATSDGAAFAVDLVGSTLTMEEQLYSELELSYREHGLDQTAIDQLQEFARLSFDYIRSGQGFERYLARHREISAGPLAPATESWPTSPEDPYWTFWRGIFDYDPMPWWSRLVTDGIPALIVYGADDGNVNVPASVARLSERLPAGGVTLRVYPGVGHSLRDPGTNELKPDIVTGICEFIDAAAPRKGAGS